MVSSLSAVCLTCSTYSSSSSSLFNPRRHGSTSIPPVHTSSVKAATFVGAYSVTYGPKQWCGRRIQAAAVVSAPVEEELKESGCLFPHFKKDVAAKLKPYQNKIVVVTGKCILSKYILPSWSEFELGIAPVFWKTTNGLPPTSGESLTLFYNPASSKLIPNDEFGVAFNGGFNQPIMCGSEPRVMTRRNRGKADPPIFIIKIRVPKHAVNLIFSFTNGVDWDGPYKLQFQTLKMWRNKPINFFNAGLAQELSAEGACERAIYPDPNNFVASCAIGNLYAEGGNSCKLNLVPGCMDPSSPYFNPLANVDDGSCPLENDADAE